MSRVLELPAPLRRLLQVFVAHVIFGRRVIINRKVRITPPTREFEQSLHGDAYFSSLVAR